MASSRPVAMETRLEVRNCCQIRSPIRVIGGRFSNPRRNDIGLGGFGYISVFPFGVQSISDTER